MEYLILINNAIGPRFQYIGLFFWALTITGLSAIWLRHKSRDAMIVMSYLSALVAISWIPGIWFEPFLLMFWHLILYTALISSHMINHCLQSRYGDWLLTLAGLMALSDAAAFALNPPIQVLLWTINILFLVMCVFTLMVCGKTHDNRGKLGKYIDVDHFQNKEGLKQV